MLLESGSQHPLLVVDGKSSVFALLKLIEGPNSLYIKGQRRNNIDLRPEAREIEGISDVSPETHVYELVHFGVGGNFGEENPNLTQIMNKAGELGLIGCTPEIVLTILLNHELPEGHWFIFGMTPVTVASRGNDQFVLACYHNNNRITLDAWAVDDSIHFEPQDSFLFVRPQAEIVTPDAPGL